MKLPSDYLAVVGDGASALLAVGRALRNTVAGEPDREELWLSVRDVEGLAGRIADLPDEDWRTGAAGLWVTGQDVGVVEELVAKPVPAVAVPAELTARLARLHDFLRRYCDGEFESDR